MIEDYRAYKNKFLSFAQVSGISGYVWYVDGQFRTVTDSLPKDNFGDWLSVGTQYKIENREGRTGFSNCVGKFCRMLFWLHSGAQL